MKKTKFTEAQIVFALKQAETGTTVAEVCRKMGISEATFHNWNRAAGAEKICGSRCDGAAPFTAVGIGRPKPKKTVI